MSFSTQNDLLAEIEIDGKFVSWHRCKYPINKIKYLICIEGIDEPFGFTSIKAVESFIKNLDMKYYFPDDN